MSDHSVLLNGLLLLALLWLHRRRLRRICKALRQTWKVRRPRRWKPQSPQDCTICQSGVSHLAWHRREPASAYLTWLTFTRIAEHEELENTLMGIAARIGDPVEAALAAWEQVEKAVFSQPSHQPHLVDELAHQALRRDVNWREIMAAYRD